MGCLGYLILLAILYAVSVEIFNAIIWWFIVLFGIKCVCAFIAGILNADV